MKKYLIRCIKLFSNNKKEIFLLLFVLLLTAFINMLPPFFLQKLIDYGFTNKDLGIITILSLSILLIYVLNSVFQLITEKIRLCVYNKVKMKLEKESFEHLLKLKRKYFDNRNASGIFQALEEDIQCISSIVSDETLSVVTALLISIGGLVSLFFINWVLALIVCLFIPIKFFITQKISMKNIMYSQQYNEKAQEFGEWFGDTVTGLKEIKILNLVDEKREKLAQKQKDIIHLNYKKTMLGCININSEIVLIELFISAIYIVAGILLLNNGISLGSIIAVETYALMFSTPISSVINIIFGISSLLPSIKRFFDFMDEEEEKFGERTAEKVESLEIKNLSFSYSDDKLLFSNISLNINSGEKIAIVGENGVGKTTLINLITRVYQPLKGEILINDVNINEFDYKALYSMIGIVEQNVYLFNNSIYNNICCGKDYSQEEIAKICDIIQLSDMLKEKTLDYSVGNNGSNLSGGQKQKIAIARTILKNTSILILDEASSNLDADTRNSFFDMIGNSLSDKIVICITHDEKIHKFFDAVYCIKNGGLELLDDKNCNN